MAFAIDRVELERLADFEVRRLPWVRHNRPMRLAALVACFLAFTGCGEDRHEAYTKAWQVTVGTTEQEVLAVAGKPSEATKATEFCERSGAVRELVYEAAKVYLGGLTTDVYAVILLCLDDKGRVIDKIDIVR